MDRLVLKGVARNITQLGSYVKLQLVNPKYKTGKTINRALGVSYCNQLKIHGNYMYHLVQNQGNRHFHQQVCLCVSCEAQNK